MTFDLNRLRHALRLALGTAIFATAAWAQASVAPLLNIHLSYDVTTSIAQPITQIMTFNQYADGNTGVWWPDSVNAGGGTISDPFAKSSDNRPLAGLMLGLTQDLPGDAVGQQHVVIMMDNSAAAAARNIAWGTLFRNNTEESILAAVALVAGVTRTDANGTEWDAALNRLFGFVNGDILTGIQVGGQAKSAFFSLGDVVAGSTSFTNFSVMAFSNGQLIGTGTAGLNTAPATAVPEPGSMALVLLGLPLLALRRKH